MSRKTIATWAAACLTMAATGPAAAYTMGGPGSGVVVPYVYHNGPGETTAVGLVTGDATTCAFTPPARIYWTFFDADSNPVKSGSFTMTHNDVHPFIWASEGGDTVKGQVGYLLFVLDTDGDGLLSMSEGAFRCLGAEAFYAVLDDNDVAFVPTLPVDPYDFAEANGGGTVNLAALGPDSLTTLIAGGTNVALELFGAKFMSHLLNLRYSVGGGDTTQIVLWSAETIGGPGVSYSAKIYDDEQNVANVSVALPHKELNVIDPAAIAGRPAGFVNGFLQLVTPASAGDGDADPDVCAPLAGSLPTTFTDRGCDGNGVVGISFIHSPGLGARQTLLAPSTAGGP